MGTEKARRSQSPDKGLWWGLVRDPLGEGEDIFRCCNRRLPIGMITAAQCTLLKAERIRSLIKRYKPSPPPDVQSSASAKRLLSIQIFPLA